MASISLDLSGGSGSVECQANFNFQVSLVYFPNLTKETNSPCMDLIILVMFQCGMSGSCMVIKHDAFRVLGECCTSLRDFQVSDDLVLFEFYLLSNQNRLDLISGYISYASNNPSPVCIRQAVKW